MRMLDIYSLDFFYRRSRHGIAGIAFLIQIILCAKQAVAFAVLLCFLSRGKLMVAVRALSLVLSKEIDDLVRMVEEKVGMSTPSKSQSVF